MTLHTFYGNRLTYLTTSHHTTSHHTTLLDTLNWTARGVFRLLLIHNFESPTRPHLSGGFVCTVCYPVPFVQMGSCYSGFDLDDSFCSTIKLGGLISVGPPQHLSESWGWNFGSPGLSDVMGCRQTDHSKRQAKPSGCLCRRCQVERGSLARLQVLAVVSSPVFVAYSACLLTHAPNILNISVRPGFLF